MRYLGGINSPSYNPLAANVTTGVTTVQDGGIYTTSSAAQASGVQQWVNDPYFNQNSILLQADNATNGSQNNTFIDTSGNNFTVTKNGNTPQGTYNPFSVPSGYWSYAFDGTGDYLTGNGSASLAFGSSDFTLECFIYPMAASGSIVIYDSRPAGTLSGAYPFLYANMTAGTVVYYVSGAIRITSNTIISPNKWYYISISRVTGNTYMTINAVQQSQSWADSTTYLNGASRPAIGSDGNSIGTTPWNGYITNLRVIVGTGIVPSSIPKAPLTAITNTQLLTCQNNRFVDNSANAIPLTPAGDVVPRPFSYFNNLPQYTAANNSGGFYVDGSGDYLSVTDNAGLELGSSDFCVECLFYATTTSVTGSIIQKRVGATVPPIIIWRNGSVVQIYLSSSTTGDIVSGVSVGSIAINQWYHVSVYRIGTSIYGSLNGVITTLKTGTSLAVLNNTAPYTFGLNGDGTTDPFTGYLSNIRFVIGSSVYTSSSAPIPTAPLTAITNTKLLISSTNAAILDATAKSALETAGNAQVSTVIKKYGSGSMYFDGTGDWVTTPSSPDTNLGTGDFTIECWINLTNASSARSIAGKGVASSTGWEIYCNATPTLLIFIYGGSITYSSNYNFNVGQWYHIAITRSGTGTNNLKMFINGTLIYESTTTTDLSTTSPLYVGAGKGGASPWFGYIDDFRITKGVARYTNNFIPPATALPRQGQG